MKTTMIKIFWGVVLVSFGGLALAGELGYIDLEAINPPTWTVIFAGLSLAFFLSYFISGVKHWGWLFPALIFAALAVIISTIIGQPDSPFVPTMILLAVGLPFYVGYLIDRKHWGLLIPAWIMTVVAFIPALSERIASNIIGASILYGIALPFLVVFLADRIRKWALITAITLAVIGSLPLVDFLYDGDMTGPIVMALFSLPFLVTFFASQKNWWALIPAGVFVSIGLVALLSTLYPNNTYFMIGEIEFDPYTSVLFLGFALTFGILWLLRGSRPTAWAGFPAVGCLIVSVLAFLFTRRFHDYLPASILLLIGLVLIITALFRRRGSKLVEP